MERSNRSKQLHFGTVEEAVLAAAERADTEVDRLIGRKRRARAEGNAYVVVECLRQLAEINKQERE